MFTEPHIKSGKKGWIEIICGSMFSGKTEELIRRLKRAQFARQKVEIFKPNLDTRYDDRDVVSHDENRIPSTPVVSSQSLLLLSQGMDVIGIDEAQFFDEALPDVVQQLAGQGIRVIVAGLDMDFKGKPFGPMPKLLAIGEFVTKLRAICVICGNPASHSYRLTQDSSQLLIGEKEMYEPRCRNCYLIGQV